MREAEENLRDHTQGSSECAAGPSTRTEEEMWAPSTFDKKINNI